MRLIYHLTLTLVALLIGSVTAKADSYNPTDPPEPGVNFTLTGTHEPADGGSTNVDGTRVVAFGTRVSLTAYPATGFRLDAWVDADGNVISTERSCTYIMPPRDTRVHARFVYDPDNPQEPPVIAPTLYSNLTVRCEPADGGSTNPTGTERRVVGSTIDLYAYSNTGFEFDHWSVNDTVTLDAGKSFRYTIGETDAVLTAHFRYAPTSPDEPGEPHLTHRLIVKSNMEGSGSVSGSGMYKEGERVHLYTYPNTYYTLVNWTNEAGTVLSTSRDFYLTMPDRDITVTANHSYDYNPSSPAEPGKPQIPTVAENTVGRPRFAMRGIDRVLIMCDTDGATIRYTTDGSEPTEDSPVYTGPVYVAGNVMVKAIGYVDGMYRSPVGIYQVSSYVVAAPEYRFVLPNIEISTSTPGAEIRYTVDASAPDSTSTIYTAPVKPIFDNMLVRAYARMAGDNPAGLLDSRESVYLYRRSDHTVPDPTIKADHEGVLTMSCPLAGASIRYTTDGTEPTEESRLYSGPFMPEGNLEYRAAAFRTNYYQSGMATYTVDYMQVAKPEFLLSGTQLLISTPTPGATVRYTIDGSTPTEQSMEVTGPIELEGDYIVKARGFKDNFRPSEVGVYSHSLHILRVPTASFRQQRIHLESVTAGAAIHYTLDGSDPRDGGAVTTYTGPFLPEEEKCLVTFYATLDGYEPSETGTFSYERQRYTLPTPNLRLSGSDLDMEVTVNRNGAPDDAVVEYNLFCETSPDGSWTQYAEPVPADGNGLWLARATHAHLLPSEIDSLRIDGRRVPTPMAEYSERTMVMTCPLEGATILYRPSGAEEREYTAPVALTSDFRCYFRATRPNWLDSERDSFEFKIDQWTLPAPVPDYDFVNRTAQVVSSLHGYAELTTHFTDGTTDVRRMEDTDILDVTERIDSIEWQYRSTSPGYYDSPVTAYKVRFHQPPYGEHDGYTLFVTATDTIATGLMMELHSSIIMISDVPQFRDRWFSLEEPVFYAVSDTMFRSPGIMVEVLGWCDGHTAECREPGLLPRVCAAAGIGPEFTMLSEVNQADIDVMASFGVRHLTLSGGGSALLDTITTLRSLSFDDGDFDFGGIRNLGWVECPGWKTRVTCNPNVIYCTDNASGHQGYVNEVSPEGNYIETLRIYDGYPFYVARDIVAGHVELTRDFTQPTKVGETRGWESITLPFTPTVITHAKQGLIAPFAQIEASGISARPFWLYAMEEGTPNFVREATIEAGKPYIISMPNDSVAYSDEYLLGGKVTFAADNVTISRTIDDMGQQSGFHAFGSLYETGTAQSNIWTLNTDAPYGEYERGSVFVAGLRGLRPFEGFFTGEAGSKPRVLSIGGDGGMTDLDLVGIDALASSDGVHVRLDGRRLMVSAAEKCRVPVMDVGGRLLRLVDVAGNGAETDGGTLAPGIYLVGSAKVVVY